MTVQYRMFGGACIYLLRCALIIVATSDKIGCFQCEAYCRTIVFGFQLSVKNCFIRGSVVRYVQLPMDECDTQILQDAARKEAAQSKQR